METLKPEVVALLQYLVPGFVAMIVYRGLIAAPHPDAFRSTIEALVFTAIIHFFVVIERWSALDIGRAYSFGEWTSAGQDIAGFLTAIFVGLLAVRITSFDALIFERLRRWRLTAQASYPNEWFGAFRREEKKWVVLQLIDGRRLYGWPAEWPSSPDTGHLRMQFARWLPYELGGEIVNLSNVSSILINVTDVRWVEFIENQQERRDDNKEPNSPAESGTKGSRKSASASAGAT